MSHDILPAPAEPAPDEDGDTMADPHDGARPDPAFHRLQSGLAAALEATGRGSTVPHVVVSLPSHSMPARLLHHNAAHLPALEDRALIDGLRAAHTPGARVVVVTSSAPPAAVLDYYARLARPHDPDGVRDHLECLVVPDDSARGIAAKLLDRPDLLDRLRALVGGRPAVVEPWNVTADEAAVALALGVPVNGGPPELWGLGFKSASRRVFREAGVPLPPGVEDVRSPADVAAAVTSLRLDRPGLDPVVVKLDNSGAGDGNWLMSTRAEDGRELSADELTDRLAADAPSWFLADLAAGGVVEEWVSGEEPTTSPSAQVQIRPDGEVVVRATHEQVLGGEDGQVFTGSRFPAAPEHSVDVARHARAVGRLLAARGVLGWLSVDFVAGHDDAGPSLTAVDLNLRKGGTTHSYTALQHLVPGTYDERRGRWVAARDGGSRHYRSGDAVAAPPGAEAADVVAAVETAGLGVDHERGTGVILHMFASLAVHGTVGATAIGRTAAEAERLFDAVPAALATAVRPGSTDGAQRA